MKATEADVHPGADRRPAHVGPAVTVAAGARLGAQVTIGGHSVIEDDVVIGNCAVIGCGVHLCNGIQLGDDVRIGANVAFEQPGLLADSRASDGTARTIIEDGVTIGAGAVIAGGVTVARGAQIAAGAVVTRAVPPFARVAGNPARITGYVGGQAIDDAAVRTISLLATGPAVAEVGVGKVTVHRLKHVCDMRGDLSVGEFPTDIPFVPQRYFLVFNVPSEETRGEHAHRACHQFLVCVRGHCAVVVDDGKSRCEVVLDAPNFGIYLPPMIWGTQYKYSADAVALAFASDHYDAADYIRDYREFCRLAKAGEALNGGR